MSDQPRETPTQEHLDLILKSLQGGAYLRLIEDGPLANTYAFGPDVSRAVAADWKSPDPETIVAAAVQVNGLTISLPRPAGHGEVLALMSEMPGYDPGIAGAIQGFATSEGRFVSRVEAMKIVHRAGQKFRTPPRSHNLFSEDLW